MGIVAAALPDADILRSLFRYEAETGFLYWRARTVKNYCLTSRLPESVVSAWNERFAGQRCFVRTDRHGYCCGNLCGERRVAHRVIWKMVHGVDPEHIDHINGDRSDNRLENLRSVPPFENALNKRLRRDNKSGVHGVRYMPGLQVWRAQITFSGQMMRLGDFAEFESAVLARRQAEARFGFHANHGDRASVC